MATTASSKTTGTTRTRKAPASPRASKTAVARAPAKPKAAAAAKTTSKAAPKASSRKPATRPAKAATSEFVAPKIVATVPPAISAPAIATPNAPQSTAADGGGKDENASLALRKKELIERVVKASSMKKRDVKPVVEAMLRIMGDALTAGEELILPPFGKAKVNRQKDLSSGEMLIVKLRRNDQQPAAPKRQDALAEAEE